MNTITTPRRLTAGPPADNLPAIVATIHHDTLAAFKQIEFNAGPLDSRTALAILVRQALEELASYWPEPKARDPEFDTALFNLRCALLPQIRGNATQVEVLRAATQRLAQQATDLEQLQTAVEQEVAELQRDLAEARAKLENTQLAPRYDWSSVTELSAGITLGIPTTPTTSHHGEDGGLVMTSTLPAAAAVTIASPAADDDEPVGVTVATIEPDEEVAAAHANFPVSNYWDWNSRVWGRAPQDVRETIRGLQNRTLKFGQVAEARRRLIARHVIASLPTTARKQSDYHATKPQWMPTATSLVSTFGLPWAELVTLGPPWP